jgi:hypothetical protein
MLTTAKWAIPYPEETDPDDPPAHFEQIAAALDVTLTGWAAPDTWANRPTGAAVKDGLFFWAVDQGQFYVGQGGALHPLTVTFGAGGDITTAAFGDGPAAGGTGRVADAGHRHGMPANPVTAHVALGDPHPLYALDTDLAAASVNSSPRYTRQLMMMGG